MFLQRWQHTSKLGMSNLLGQRARERKTERKRDEERGRVGGDVTFHLATVATLDACGKLPLRVPFDARQACTRVCDCCVRL